MLRELFIRMDRSTGLSYLQDRKVNSFSVLSLYELTSQVPRHLCILNAANCFHYTMLVFC